MSSITGSRDSRYQPSENVNGDFVGETSESRGRSSRVQKAAQGRIRGQSSPPPNTGKRNLIAVQDLPVELGPWQQQQDGIYVGKEGIKANLKTAEVKMPDGVVLNLLTGEGKGPNGETFRLNKDGTTVPISPPDHRQGPRQAPPTSQVTSASSSLPQILPGLTVQTRPNAPRPVGNATGMFKAVKIQDAEGKLKTYWLWATTKTVIDGVEQLHYHEITDTDTEPLTTALKPILEAGIQQNPDLAGKQIDFAVETQRTNAGLEHIVTLTDHSDEENTAEVSAGPEEYELKIALQNFSNELERITDPNRVSASGQPTMRSAKDFNEIVHGSPTAPTAGAGKRNTASKSAKNNPHRASKKNKTESLVDVLEDANKALTPEHLAQGLKAIHQNFSSAENCPTLHLPPTGVWESDPAAEGTLLGSTRLPDGKGPYFIPICTKAVDEADSPHFVYLCVLPKTRGRRQAYYYDPLGRPIGANAELAHNAENPWFGFDQLTPKLNSMIMSGTAHEKEIAKFLRNSGVTGLDQYVSDSPHQTDPCSSGLFGFSWYEGLCNEFTQKTWKDWWTLSEEKRFKAADDIADYRTGFTERFSSAESAASVRAPVPAAAPPLPTSQTPAAPTTRTPAAPSPQATPPVSSATTTSTAVSTASPLLISTNSAPPSEEEISELIRDAFENVGIRDLTERQCKSVLQIIRNLLKNKRDKASVLTTIIHAFQNRSATHYAQTLSQLQQAIGESPSLNEEQAALILINFRDTPILLAAL